MAVATAITTQNLAGHTSLETTMRYMHLSPNAADEAVRLLAGRALPAVATSWQRGPESRNPPVSPGDFGGGAGNRIVLWPVM